MLKKNETIGYDGEYKAKKNILVGICNIGYYNGLRRNYKGRLSINDKYYRVIGRICMNQMFILIDYDVKIGDKVIIFGKNITKKEFLLHNNMSNYESFLLIR
jgi:alanine racemase